MYTKDIRCNPYTQSIYVKKSKRLSDEDVVPVDLVVQRGNQHLDDRHDVLDGLAGVEVGPDGLVVVTTVLDMDPDIIGALDLLQGIDELGLLEIQRRDAPYGVVGRVDLAHLHMARLCVEHQLVVGRQDIRLFPVGHVDPELSRLERGHDLRVVGVGEHVERRAQHAQLHLVHVDGKRPLRVFHHLEIGLARQTDITFCRHEARRVGEGAAAVEPHLRAVGQHHHAALAIGRELMHGHDAGIEIGLLRGRGVEPRRTAQQQQGHRPLVAEMNEFKANPSRYASGVVIESKKDNKVGTTATLLIQNGTLRIGDPIVVGNFYGKVRTLKDDRGNNVTEAKPSTPVEVTGLSEVPSAGDKFMAFESEKQAKEIAHARELRSKEADTNFSGMTLEDLFGKIQEGVKEIKVVLKADVNGSLEAVKNALEKIDVEGVKVSVIRGGVGAITESDVVLASASHAIIIGVRVYLSLSS